MKTIHTFIFIIIALLLQSCGKENNSCCDPQKFNYFHLSEAATKQTPYFTNRAFDTISFVSHEEDTITFVKTRTDSTWDCEYASSNPDNNTQNCYQILHNTYKTIKGNGTFDVKHTEYKGVYDFINISFNQYYFLFGGPTIGDPSNAHYLDNVNVNNKIFSNAVYQFHNNDANSKIRCFVNSQYGLFHISDSITSASWSIIK
ncbi:MAG: hypothetical protein V4620_00080 [Bacteroidota bacterium]